MLWKLSLIVSSVLATTVAGKRILQDEGGPRVRTDLVRLIPFDVQIAMYGNPQDVNVYALTDVVTDWMDESFKSKSASQNLLNNNTTFDSIALELQRRRNLQEAGTSSQAIGLYTASFEGVSLWDRAGSLTAPMDPELVELIQRATFLEDNKLLTLLQSAEDFSGLGANVVDVRAYITPPTTQSNENSLEIIIIIAIVVACLAFALLMFAVIWAWRTDKAKNDTFKPNAAADRSVEQTPDGTGSGSYGKESPPIEQPAEVETPPPPAEIPANSNYPESVISEDISTSLTAYYKAGMGSYNYPKKDFNDAASMSSMDSYGYSLDGYAHSIGGPVTMGYPATLGSGPVNGQIKDPNYDDDDEEE